MRLSELLEVPELIHRAAELGERLLAAAECDERGCSWPSVLAPHRPHLTGYSHGAAGIGMALFELWQATGERRLPPNAPPLARGPTGSPPGSHQAASVSR